MIREGDPRAPMGRGIVRALSLLLVSVNVVVSGALLAAAIGLTDVWAPGRILLAAIGAFWLLTSFLLLRGWTLRPSRRRLVASTHVDGVPATVIRMSPHRLHEGVWLAGGIVVLCAVGTVLFTITDGPDGVIGLLLLFTGPLILLLLPIGIDMAVASVRGGSVVLTATGIEVRSWYSTAHLVWESVHSITIVTPQHGTQLFVSGGPITVTRRFSLWTWHERHREHQLVLDLDALEPHGRPLKVLLHQATRDPRLRVHFGSPWAQSALEPHVTLKP